MESITGVQLLTEDFFNINLEPDDIQYIELHDPNRKPADGDFEVSYAKIIIKNAETCLKESMANLFEPGTWKKEDSAPETASRQYNRLLSRNVYGISIMQKGEWKSYYFSPDEWVEDKNGVWINSRVKIEKAGECTIITANRY
jgi:hypothetical protein